MAVDNTARGLAGKALSAGATIADGSVTYAKIQNVSATDKLLGRSTAGAGVVEEIALTAAGRALIDDADASAQRTTLGLGTIATQAASSVAITGGSVTGITDLTVADGGTGVSTFTDGGVLIGNGTSAVQVTTAGTSGQVLTSNGAGVDPTFQTLAAGGGSWTYLSTVTASSSATVDIETTLDATYDEYALIISGLTPASTTGLLCEFKIAGSYTAPSADYAYHYVTTSVSSAAYAGAAVTGATSIRLTPNIGNTGGKNVSLDIRIHRPSSTALVKAIDWRGVMAATSGATSIMEGVGAFEGGTAAITGLRFTMTTGTNIATGTFRLYGIKNS